MSGLETLGSWHTRGWQCALPHHKTCSLRNSRHPADLPQISIWLSMYVMLWNKSDPWKHRHPVCCEVWPPCVGLVPGCPTNAQSGWTLGKLEANCCQGGNALWHYLGVCQVASTWMPGQDDQCFPFPPVSDVVADGCKIHSPFTQWPTFSWIWGCVKLLVIEWQLLPVNTLIEKCDAGKWRSVRD